MPRIVINAIWHGRQCLIARPLMLHHNVINASSRSQPAFFALKNVFFGALETQFLSTNYNPLIITLL